MVVYSASVVSKKRILLSRQFVEMTRGDVENYLNTFMKRIEHYNLSNEYTYMENGNIRYVYQILDDIYMVLMTPLSSNIIEDLDTLRLFCQVLYDSCSCPPPLTEELIISNCFDIIFAFDEVISFGYKESVTLNQIKTYLEMESQEEKLHKIIRQNKENEERERRKQIASKLDKERSYDISLATSSNNNLVRSSLSGIAAFAESVGVSKLVQSVGINPNKIGFGSNMNNIDNMNVLSNIPISTSITSSTTNTLCTNSKVGVNAPSKGMFIGKKKPTMELIQEKDDKKVIEEKQYDLTSSLPLSISENIIDDDNALIEERCEAILAIDGSLLSKVDIQGTFQIKLEKEEFPEYTFHEEDERFQYKVHPNLSKEKYQRDGLLRLREDLKSALPKNILIPLVKWRSSGHNAVGTFELPIAISCWPVETADGFTNVTLEIESNRLTENIAIIIPISSIISYNISNGIFDSSQTNSKNSVIWNIESLSPGNNAILEFITEQRQFVPIKINAFIPTYSYCNLSLVRDHMKVRPYRKTLLNLTLNQ
ncbi:hypothetical protein cand_019670 [Cryptosporidium andersoni]|uniref:Coatomer subunit delta n=1 Tax=Cryptosporidium andersoni TaxID=117008 RepID=A0A1J4MSN0_9CRYT|nr:hypothetical protein cand_019670 [Cryptosporidium andersoni]